MDWSKIVLSPYKMYTVGSITSSSPKIESDCLKLIKAALSSYVGGTFLIFDFVKYQFECSTNSTIYFNFADVAVHLSGLNIELENFYVYRVVDGIVDWEPIFVGTEFIGDNPTSVNLRDALRVGYAAICEWDMLHVSYGGLQSRNVVT